MNPVNPNYSAAGAFVKVHALSICLIFLFIFHSGRSQIPGLRFEHLTTQDGLPGPGISDIVQDRAGFIWFGTSNGLARYDGYEFKNYFHREEDARSLSDNSISCLYVTRDGTLWAGTYSGLHRFDAVAGAFDRFQADSSDVYSLSSNRVKAILEDSDQNLWVGTDDGGLNRFDPGSGKFYHYRHDPSDSTGLGDNCVNTITQDRNGFLWIGTNNGLDKFDPETGQFTHFRPQKDSPNSLSQEWVTSVCEDKNGMIWAGTISGLNRLDPETGLITRFWPNWDDPESPFGLSSSRIVHLLVDNSQQLWVGTQFDGINLYDFDKQQFYAYTFKPGQPHTLIGNNILTMFQDREGIIWIGTMTGISILKPALQQFQVFGYEPGNDYSLNNDEVISIFEDAAGDLWLGTMDGGLNYLDRQTHQFHNFQERENPLNVLLGTKIINCIFEDDDGALWLGTTGSGLLRFDRKTNTVKRFLFSPSNRNFILSILKDRAGQIWFGSAGGLNRFDPASGEADYFPYEPEDPNSRMSSSIKSLYEDLNNNLWVGTYRYGLKRFNRTTEQYDHFRHDPENPESLADNNILAILEDRRERLWIATFGGLNQFLPETGTFIRYQEKDGLPSNMVVGMVDDASGNLWLSTSKGLSKFDPEAGTFRNFGIPDGLPTDDLGPLVKSRQTGKVFVAGHRGLTVFSPDEIQDAAGKPPVVLTRFLRYNTDLGEGLPIADGEINEKKAITLSHKDDILTFEFAALSYQKTRKNQYAYRLEGFNKDWIQLGTRRNISFTDLDPGDYTLRVKGSNGDNIWNHEGTALRILITPPWYWAWWSKMLYIFLIASGVYWIYRFQVNRRLAAAETERLRELDEFKSRLYTNITHEFRTPLTVIQGVVDKMVRDPAGWLSRGHDMIRRNSRDLLRLVNQMLDLSKLEAGKLELKMIQSDVIIFLRYLLESFHSLADTKAISLYFESDQEQLSMDYDPDHLQDIVSNLLSNALKFTPDGGSVRLSVSMEEHAADSYLKMQVQDTGTGIPPEQIDYVFDRFYQVEDTLTRKGEGTGIGLTLTRELVVLMGGRIEVESELGKGSTFIVHLPVHRNAPPAQELKEGQVDREAHPGEFAALEESRNLNFLNMSTSEMPAALIVEDNPDVVRYLRSCLEGEYRLEVAYNGREGIDKALRLVPDIIISDVMMPEVDGYTLCKTLKSELVSSHIPIILLTAKADAQSRISGLERGADAYLAKPFDEKELRVRMAKLLELRQRLQKKFGSPSYLARAAKKGGTLEETFLQRLRKIVEDHLDDHQLDVSTLCTAMAISRTPLHNKLKALTGKTTTEFIRSIRLNHARGLLIRTDLNVSEIAYRVGFQNHNYFTRVFRELYILSPSEYRAANQTGTG